MRDQPNPTKPKDAEIRRVWSQAVRLSQPWKSKLANRLALALADGLEARGVTEADIDRVMT